MLRRDIIYKELSYILYGLLFQTHNDLGRYRKEKEYGDYFEELLKSKGIKYKREYRVKFIAEDRIEVRNICDFYIDNKIILEFKTVSFIGKKEYFQIKAYLSALKIKLGIIINFRQKNLIPKRIINNEIN